MQAQQILDHLKTINYKNTTENIVDLGLLSAINVQDHKISFALKVIEDELPYFQELAEVCRKMLNQHYLKAQISIVLTKHNTPASKEKISLPGVKKIIAIASCKGGVGKSTVTVNLAAALAKAGKQIGLADLDIYGPSIGTMLALDELPMSEDNKLIPLTKYGISSMSFGYLIAQNKAAIWRGPMVSKALHQILTQTKWPSLDVLLLDLPPGTGDIHLSLLANYQIDGVIMVCTPQLVAIKDVIKSIDMYQKMDIKMLGIVENMSYLLDANGIKQFIFGKDKVQELAKNYNIPYLSAIPLEAKISQGGDEGLPVVLTDEKISKYFDHIIEKIDL
jgi:ATP-binding protein involved in chromosome partitioning